MAGTPKRRQEDRERALADGWGRLVQVSAIIAVVIMVVVDHERTIPAYIYGGLLGIAIGAKPEDLLRLRK